MTKSLIFLILTLNTQLSLSACGMIFLPFHHLDGGRAISELREVKIGTYNVLNLEFSPGKYVDSPITKTREFVSQVITKNQKEVEGIAKVIKSEDLDILILQEVEGKVVLELFNKKYLNSAYKPMLIPGNDGRGIEIAFLVKKDLPFKLKLSTNKHSSWKNPTSQKEGTVFSRDLPALHIWNKNSSGTDPPGMVIFGNHLKSQRDRAGDFKSVKMRTAQANEIKKVISEYKEAYPKTPILLAGDFNADVPSSIEFKSLFEKDFLYDSFNFSAKKLTKKERITHTFHPRVAKTQSSQLDAILVNKSASQLIINMKVHRYKDGTGKALPIPRTYDERSRNPSDHFPIIMTVDLSGL